MTEVENSRPLSNSELSILNKLLSKDFPSRNELKAQISESSALPTNDPDNYGSVLLSTKSTVKAQVNERIPVEAAKRAMQPAGKSKIDLYQKVKPSNEKSDDVYYGPKNATDNDQISPGHYDLDDLSSEFPIDF